MMKKAFYFITAAVLLVALAACANPLEKAIENAAAEQGQDVDVNIDSSGDGSVSMDFGDGENGGSLNIDSGGMEWPGDKLPANVPSVPGVKITAVMDVGAVMVVFEECDQSTAEAYIQTLKDKGWEVTMDMDAGEDGRAVYFKDSNENVLTLGFNKADGTGSVSYSEKE